MLFLWGNAVASLHPGPLHNLWSPASAIPYSAGTLLSAEAQAAFAYAAAHGYTRNTVTPAPPIPQLPVPVGERSSSQNPLHGDDVVDGRWFVVYRGISPGIYRSHLECQLNIIGISNAAYEAVRDRPMAVRKLTVALERGEVRVITPAYTM
ncbi:hypothetical protein R3P38DRAFT_3239317 [Favolaschia claudopus]|uniref:Ribonuclease H1 N-terminal domain-containing protein n=1 Tax=Favolaschia claudopus TaxID=2862362 RepID=A0AAV9Z7Y8_9AGAR